MVNDFSAVDVIPKPIWSAKRSRKSVEATHAVRLIKTKLVCSFLRRRSFTGKKVSLIFGRQRTVLQTQRPVGKLHQFWVMSRHDNCFASLF